MFIFVHTHAHTFESHIMPLAVGLVLGIETAFFSVTNWGGTLSYKSTLEINLISAASHFMRLGGTQMIDTRLEAIV